MAQAEHHVNNIVRCIFLLCLLLSGCSTLGSSNSTAETREGTPEFSRALAFYSQGLLHEMDQRYERAHQSYLRAIELDPSRQETYVRAAFNALRLNQPDEAKDIMQRLVEQTPDSTESWYLKAKLCLQTRDFEDAERAYLKVLELDPSATSAHLEYTGFLIARNREPDALQHIDSARERVRDPGEFFSRLSMIYLRRANAAADDPVASESLREQAVAFLEQAAEAAPERSELMIQLADLYVLADQMAPAADIYRDALQRMPDDEDLRRKLGLALVAIGEEAEAIQVLEPLTQEAGAASNVHMYLAAIYQQIDDPESAAEQLRKVIATAEQPVPEAYLKLAMLLLDRDDPEAVDILRQGAEALPDHLLIREMLAFAYFNDENYEAAMSAFEETWTLYETDEDADPNLRFHLFHVVSAQLSGHLEQSVDRLEDALQQEPETLEAYIQVVFQKEEEDAVPSAIQVLTRLSERLENPFRALVYVGLFHNQQDDFEAAYNAFQSIESDVEQGQTELDPEDPLTVQYYFWYGAACERLEKYDQAEELFEACLRIEPEHAEAYNYLAYMWAEQDQNLDQAKMYVAKALEQDPDNGAFLDTLGWIYYRQGQYNIALNYIRQAADLIPDDPVILEHLGDIANAMNRMGDAVDYWRQSLDIDPENDAVREKLEQALASDADSENEPTDDPSTDPPA